MIRLDAIKYMEKWILELPWHVFCSVFSSHKQGKEPRVYKCFFVVTIWF